jgi:hypothetical protein
MVRCYLLTAMQYNKKSEDSFSESAVKSHAFTHPLTFEASSDKTLPALISPLRNTCIEEIRVPRTRNRDDLRKISERPTLSYKLDLVEPL